VGDWISSYIQTYVERDVRDLKQITDLTLFQKFIQLCAGRIGQILDLTSIGNDCGISAHTVRSWLSILESCYIVFLLQPHYKNFSKRLIKSPKLYFYDTGIACHLLSIRSPKDLANHYLRGGLFESMILSDLLKQRYNAGLLPNLYYWRDKSGLEIDCVLEKGETLIPIEMKSGETLSSDFFSSLVKWNELTKHDPSHSYVIYGGNGHYSRSQGTAIGWQQLHLLPTL
jgi:predicted AAA+ superfamily ATPase